MITREVGTGAGRLFVRLIVRLALVGTVINGGAQPPVSFVFNAVHVAPAAPESRQVKPHIGTVWPSGRVVVVACARRFTVCAKDIPAVRRRIVTASAAVFKVALSKLDRIARLLRITAFRQSGRTAHPRSSSSSCRQETRRSW